MSEQSDRSYEPVTVDDLRRLAEIARVDREDFFARKSRYAVLADRILGVALCQGAALHYVDGRNGVKDFDVWTFYADEPSSVKYPLRRRMIRDFGYPKFGQSPDCPSFIGRRVDLLGRSVKVAPETESGSFLRWYLSESQTEAARQLAQKAVVLLEPLDRIGTVVWPDISKPASSNY